MRIIFINRFFSPDHSATSQMVSDLAFYLAGRGHEVLVITSRQRYDAPDARLATEEHINGVAIHRVWTSRFGRGFLPGRAIDYLTFYLSTAWRLLRLARAGDVVVAKTEKEKVSGTLLIWFVCNRLVERNALRANLVERAEDWRWGSLWRRCCGTTLQRELLSEGPLSPLPDWVQRVNQPETSGELDVFGFQFSEKTCQRTSF